MVTGRIGGILPMAPVFMETPFVNTSGFYDGSTNPSSFSSVVDHSRFVPMGIERGPGCGVKPPKKFDVPSYAEMDTAEQYLLRNKEGLPKEFHPKTVCDNDAPLYGLVRNLAREMDDYKLMRPRHSFYRHLIVKHKKQNVPSLSSLLKATELAMELVERGVRTDEELAISLKPFLARTYNVVIELQTAALPKLNVCSETEKRMLLRVGVDIQGKRSKSEILEALDRGINIIPEVKAFFNTWNKAKNEMFDPSRSSRAPRMQILHETVHRTDLRIRAAVDYLVKCALLAALETRKSGCKLKNEDEFMEFIADLKQDRASSNFFYREGIRMAMRILENDL